MSKDRSKRVLAALRAMRAKSPAREEEPLDDEAPEPAEPEAAPEDPAAPPPLPETSAPEEFAPGMPSVPVAGINSAPAEDPALPDGVRESDTSRKLKRAKIRKSLDDEMDEAWPK